MRAPSPTITVVIAVRNAAATLQRALDSVFEQTYEHVELIVIDGASTDGSAEIITTNAGRIAHWESKRDRGIYHAWNKALEHATGEWVCFLGADDRFHAPDVLDCIGPRLAAAAGRYRVVYGRLTVVDGEGRVVRSLGEEWDRAVFRDHMTTPHPATFHHRTLFERHGRFDERFRIVGDYELLLRELLDHDALFVPDCLVVDMGAGGISAHPSSTYRVVREIHQARYLHGLGAAPGWRSGPFVRALIRIWISRRFGPAAAELIGGAYRFLRRGPAPPN